MRRLLFLTVILGFSCKSSVPSDILPPKKMGAVLWDVMQADEMAEYYGSMDSSYRHLAKHSEYYQKVFAIHKVAKQDFIKSLSYYEDHPADLKSILDSLQSYAQRIDRADTAKKPATPVVIDSNFKKRLLHKQPH
jgi:hypothetical protein